MKAHVIASGMPFQPGVESSEGSVRAYVENDGGAVIQVMLREDNRYHITMLTEYGVMREIGSGLLRNVLPSFELEWK